MKLYEETWSVDEDSVSLDEAWGVMATIRSDGGDTLMSLGGPSTAEPADIAARARLAAAAPEMARLLQEWLAEGSLKTEDVERVLRKAGAFEEPRGSA